MNHQTDLDLVRPSHCVIGEEYLLQTPKGWERVVAMGKQEEDKPIYYFYVKRTGWFRTKYRATILRVHVGDPALRKKEPIALA